MERSVGLVVYRHTPGGNVYLLLHYRAGHWDFPKGHVKDSESEQQTALRELREETRITDAEILDCFKDRVAYSFRHNNRLIFKEVIYYIACTQTARVRLSREHRGCAWLSADAAMKRLTHENSRGVLRRARSRLKDEAQGLNGRRSSPGCDTTS